MNPCHSANIGNYCRSERRTQRTLSELISRQKGGTVRYRQTHAGTVCYVALHRDGSVFEKVESINLPYLFRKICIQIAHANELVNVDCLRGKL